MNAILPLVLSLVSGVGLAVQPLVNGRLARALGGVVWAAGISATLTSVICLVSASMFLGTGGFSSLSRVPWWAWIGGLFGVPALVGMTWAVPRIGAAPVLVLVILGQLFTGALADWYGLSYEGATVSPTRLFGIAVVFVGACIVLWKPD